MFETVTRTADLSTLTANEFVGAWPSHQTFVDLGLIDYEKALEIQLAFLSRVHERDEAGFIILCRHQPIITLGRATKDEDITSWTGAKIEVSRGGRVTYHGPSQLIVYPIVNLTHPASARAQRDILSFIRALESCVVDTLQHFGLEAHGKSGEHDTGIWVNDHKIASIGIAVRHWITYHGAAINIENDVNAFKGIKPCGLESSVMTSVQEVSDGKVSRATFQSYLVQKLKTLVCP